MLLILPQFRSKEYGTQQLPPSKAITDVRIHTVARTDIPRVAKHLTLGVSTFMSDCTSVVSNLFLLSILVLPNFFSWLHRFCILFLSPLSLHNFSCSCLFLSCLLPVYKSSYSSLYFSVPLAAVNSWGSLSCCQGVVCSGPRRSSLFTTHQSTTWVILHQAAESAWCLAPLLTVDGWRGECGKRNRVQRKKGQRKS